MAEFMDRERAKALLASSLAVLPALQTEHIVDACVDEFREAKYPSLPPGVSGVPMTPRMHWVIRDEDLRAFEAFSSALTAKVKAAPFSASTRGPTLISILTAVFGAYNQLRKKGATLTIDQCQALVALQRAGAPSSVDQLSDLTELRAPDLEAVLTSLTELRCTDGSVVAVASRDPYDRWAPQGI
jgi:hypothetical protein